MKAALMVVVTTLTAAQGPSPTFDVTSVKPNTSGATGGRSSCCDGGGYTGTNVTVRRVMGLAYMPTPEIVGGPSWIYTDLFDIQGRTARRHDRPEVQLMLRALLADRFKLRVHRETREMPAYALVLARTDGQVGPQLVHAQPCPAASPTQPEPRGQSCGGFNLGRGTLRGRSVTTSQIARELGAATDGRHVLDRTGLAGPFDVTLTWNADALSAGAGSSDSPSIFSALQEQLGLSLESITAPIEVIVIDSAERPEPD